MNYFELGWALRENQIFGKRGGNKRMSEQVKQLLRTYFLSGNIDKKNRFTAETMFEDLKQRVETNELDASELPKIKTIENWIKRFSREHKKESAEKELNIMS
jgi:hypothetical protein